jgi:glycoside/pentoside/hexuronide:cation symporter, GPH family
MAEAMPKPGLWTKLVYGLGSFAFGTKDAGFNTFLLIFYNQVLGVRASLVSLAIAIALVVDALADPLIGELSDNWRSRLGRRHPFMYGAALPAALLYFALWNPPHWSSSGLFFYLLATAILVRMFVATYEIPSTALAPELSADYNQRTTLLAFRWLFGAFGAGITLAVALTLFMTPTKTNPVGILNPGGYFSYSVMAACVMFAAILISAAGTHGRIRYMRQAPVRSRPTLKVLAREVLESISNKEFVSITVAAIFGGIGIGLVIGLGTYINTFFWKFTAAQLGALALGAACATVLAVILAPVLTSKLDKKRGYMVTAIGSVIVNNITITLKLFGLLPVANANVLLAIIFVSTTVGLALAICSAILIGSMITDVVEDNELKTGRRSEGLFSAAISFVAKSTNGFGILLSGLIIDFVHFPKNARPLTIDPAIMHHLLYIYMPLQLVLFAVSIACLSRYRIDRAVHHANLARLAETAAAAESVRVGVST